MVLSFLAQDKRQQQIQVPFGERLTGSWPVFTLDLPRHQHVQPRNIYNCQKKCTHKECEGYTLCVHGWSGSRHVLNLEPFQLQAQQTNVEASGRTGQLRWQPVNQIRSGTYQTTDVVPKSRPRTQNRCGNNFTQSKGTLIFGNGKPINWDECKSNETNLLKEMVNSLKFTSSQVQRYRTRTFL